MNFELNIRTTIFLIIFFMGLGKSFSQTVFVSSNGKKYHAENCPDLYSDRKAISLEEAKKQGYKVHKQCKDMNIKKIEKQAGEDKKKKEETGSTK